MINRIIHFSIYNKKIIGLFIIALIIFGGYSATQLPIDVTPDITNNQVQVITVTPNLATQEVEQFVTSPLELAMANIPKVQEIRSTSMLGLSTLTVVFKDNMDNYLARQLVNEKISEAKQVIPEGFGKPEMSPISTGLGEIYQYIIEPMAGYEDKYSAMDLRTIQDWIIKRQLSGIEGVVEINSFGGYLKEYEIAVNPDKLRSQKITINDIFYALEENNENTGASYIEKYKSSYFIRTEGLTKNLEDIRNISVKEVNGVPVLIRDVAEVRFGHAIRYGALTTDGKGEAVGGIVMMLKGENSARVVERVKLKMEEIKKSLPQGVQIKPFIDRTRLVKRTINTVTKNLIEGALIVILVLVLLVGNFRAGLIIASVIPLSMLFAFMMMNLFGVSANLMSLGAIDFGLIVDGAVIIVESALFFIHNKYRDSISSPEELNHCVETSSTKIMKSATFGIFIILVVYFPILSLVGIEGKMFRPMAMTVSFALIGALLLSLTYVPMISSLTLRSKHDGKFSIANKIMNSLHNIYLPSLKYSMRHKAKILVLTSILFLVSLYLFSRLGGVFIPTLDEGDLAVEALVARGTSFTQSIATYTEFEKILKENFPEVEKIITKIGSAEIPTDPQTVESGDITIILKDKKQWTSAMTKDELVEKMKGKLSVLPSANFSFSQPIQLRFNELITGTRSDIAIKIYGDDLDILAQKANETADIIKNINGIGDLKVEPIHGLSEIVISFNRSKLGRYGLSVKEVNQVIRAAFAGEKAGVVFEGEKRFDIVVRFNETFKKDIDNIKNLYVRTSNNVQIPLFEIADIKYTHGPVMISRDNTKRRIVIGINNRNRDVESLVEEIKQNLDEKLILPAGYSISYGGQFQNLKEAKQRLSLAIPAALILIFIFLFFAFNSAIEAIIIYTAIPLAAIGGVFALWSRNMPFSISAGVGFIALFGVATLNGIVLISYFNQLLQEGRKNINHRIIQGASVRLRPVIMTAAVASLGFLPIAVSTSAGAEVQKPLATVVIGGLITSTLLTLIILPILYSLLINTKFKEMTRTKRGIKTTITIIFLMLVSLPAKSQENQPLTLEKSIEIAIKNNLDVKSSLLKVEKQRILTKTAFDLSKTTLNYINEPDIDRGSVSVTNFEVIQDFNFPTVYFRQSKFLNQQALLAEKSSMISQNDVVASVRDAYFSILYYKSNLALVQKLDSLYKNFFEIANIRRNTGETSNLEMLTAQNKISEIKLRMNENNTNLAGAFLQLQKILNLNGKISVQDSALYELNITITNDSTTIYKSPYIALSGQLVNTSKTEYSLEKSRVLPDFSLGYIHEPVKNNGTYYGYQIGMNIPIWYKPQKNRIKAAQIDINIAQNEYLNEVLSYQTMLNKLLQQLSQFDEKLKYFTNEGLPLANEIIKTSISAYKAGEIDYVEFVQNINQALDLKSGYLETLFQHNQVAIIINQITGN